MIDGTILPINEVLPILQSINHHATYTIDGVYLRKSNVMHLITLKNKIVCEICHRPASFFKFHKRCTHNPNMIRLVFDHVDNYGERAFMTVDHILPKSKGGTESFENLQLACNICNGKKYNNTHQALSMGFQPINQGNWINCLVYIAYIKWYLRVFDKCITVNGWKNQSIHIYRGIKNTLQKRGEFDSVAYTNAKNEMNKMINNAITPTTHLKTKIVDILI